MDFLNDAIAALNSGVDRIFGAPLESLLMVYASFLVYQGRTVLLKGIPAVLHAGIASAIDMLVMPIVKSAVRAAEEHGERLAKVAIARGVAAAQAKFTESKLQYAKAYIKAWLPDWLVSDETVERWIHAGLAAIGRGASKGVTIGVEYVEQTITNAPLPPAA